MQPQAKQLKKYVGWPSLPAFFNDCCLARQTDSLVSQATAAAILGYAKVTMRRIIDQNGVSAWAWYEGEGFHPSELVVSVQSLISYGLHKGRLGDYEKEKPIQSLLNREAYEQLQWAIESETNQSISDLNQEADGAVPLA
jgi:hypothetical protein